MRHLILCLFLVGCVLGEGCKKELSASGNPTTITLQFTNVVSIGPLTLGNIYTNSLNQQFEVSAFKYYISNVRLFSANGEVQSIAGIYHLVDAADSASCSLSFPATADSLTALSFLIGVDSTRIASGNQSGDLSPAKGMYLGKSNGYIMAELEGSSPASTLPTEKFQYDIQGYTGADNVLRTVTLPLSGVPVNLNSVLPDTLLISMDADVNAWFLGPHVLSINQYSSCITPGPLASEFADNYAHMFIVRNVQVK